MNESKQRPQSDEIDLSHFFRATGRAFSNFGKSSFRGVAGLRNTFYNNRLFFLGVIVLGLILGTLYSEVLKKDYYKSTMVLSCDYLNTQILQNTIDKLDILADEEDGEGLQQILGIENSQARNIAGFAFRPFISEDDVVEMEVLRTQLNSVAADKRDIVDKVIDKLTIENKNAYEISVLVYDPDIVKPLETAFVRYFRENNYIKRRMESNRLRLLDRKEKLSAELRKLDSLKGVLFQNYAAMAQKGRGSNNVVVGDETLTNPIEIFNKDLALHEELQEVEELLYLSPDFEIVDGFTSFQEPESASLPDILAISLLLSIVIGYLILGAYRFDRMLAEYPTKRSAARA